MTTVPQWIHLSVVDERDDCLGHAMGLRAQNGLSHSITAFTSAVDKWWSQFECGCYCCNTGPGFCNYTTFSRDSIQSKPHDQRLCCLVSSLQSSLLCYLVNQIGGSHQKCYVELFLLLWECVGWVSHCWSWREGHCVLQSWAAGLVCLRT